MKKVFMVVGRNFSTLDFGIKFALRDELGEQLIYGFPLIEDTKVDYSPFHAGQLCKLQLTELRKFIDEALEEIEKNENDK